MSNMEGRYLYCIINSGESQSFGDTGIDANSVYAIPYKNIAAVVHPCMAKPYKTEDKAKVAEWILSHNYVVDQATKEFGTVLPFSFDTIVRGNNETVYFWMEKSFITLREELDRLKNKAEYSIQIFCEDEYLKANLASGDLELEKMKEKINKMSKGAAYLFQRKYEIKVKDAISVEVSRLSHEFRSEIKMFVEEIREENNMQAPEKYNGKKPIMALSCLVHEDKIEKLGNLLDEINKRQGFDVRFTGPWAPYSFVRRFDCNANPVYKGEGDEHGS